VGVGGCGIKAEVVHLLIGGKRGVGRVHRPGRGTARGADIGGSLISIATQSNSNYEALQILITMVVIPTLRYCNYFSQ
jgi:hypothetical protein